MPDDRFLHPRLGHSQKVCSLTDFEARVWSNGYILAADDCGVMRCSAVTLQNANEALAQRPAKLIEKALDRLIEIGLLVSFEHQGRKYVCQLDWQDWQRVRYPRESLHPDPPPDVLNKCTVATQKLFSIRAEELRKRAGKIPGTDPESSGNSSATSLSPTRAGTRERLTANGKRLTAPEKGFGEKPASTARSGRPIFIGQRLTVFEWMHDDCVQLLGDERAEQFDLHDWYFALEAKCLREDIVPPKRDSGAWFQAELIAEAQRRGLSIRLAAAPKAPSHRAQEPTFTVPDAEETKRRMRESRS